MYENNLHNGIFVSGPRLPFERCGKTNSLNSSMVSEVGIALKCGFFIDFDKIVLRNHSLLLKTGVYFILLILKRLVF